MADKAFYPPAPATDVGGSRPAAENSVFEVFELWDTAYSTPLPLQTEALTNGAPLLTTAQGVMPGVYVISPSTSHNFRSGDWIWRRDSFTRAEEILEEAAAAISEAAAGVLKPADQAVDEGIARADLPSTVSKLMSLNPTVSKAAADAAREAVTTSDLVLGSDPRLPEQNPLEELLAVLLDDERRQTWLGARASDGGPSDWAMHHLTGRLGVAPLETAPGYLAALTDAAGNLTDLAIRASDGQFADFVVARLAGRVSAFLPKPTPVDPASPHPSGVRPDMVPLLQSIANAAGRNVAGVPAPTGATDFTANGEAARLTFPTRYSDATPVPLIIQFEGVGDRTLDPRAAYREPVRELGALYAKCTFHGDSYGSPAAMADARAIYEYALRVAPISGVILMGNSMGGVGALNALHTGAIPNVLGVYLTDPVYDLRQRYTGGRAAEINAAYGIATDGSNYTSKTAGFDPALAPSADFQGVPIKIVHSSTDTSVQLDLHGRKLVERLAPTNDIELIDTGIGGHNTPDRFIPAELTKFITKVAGGPAGLRA